MEIKMCDETLEFYSPVTVENIIENSSVKKKKNVMAAVIANQVYDLNEIITDDTEITPIFINSELGNRIYRRSLFLVLAKAVYELFPEAILNIEISLSNGIYCELKKEKNISKKDIYDIKSKMKEIIEADLKIIKKEFSQAELLKIYENQNCDFRKKLIKERDKDLYKVYELDGYYDYFYYNMVPSTGYLNEFDLHLRIPGFILLFPKFFEEKIVPPFKEQPKLAKVYLEYEKLGEILDVNNVVDLNQVVADKEYGELIRIAEGLHEKNIAKIADQIKGGMPRNKIILIAGPSASGKTTFTHRLSTQLRINGLRPVQISVDDYFVNRDETPRHKDGSYNFESINAIDLELFNNHLLQLIQGKKIELPVFNFEKGIREKSGKFLFLKEDQPILIEGIHGLNDRMTETIPQDLKFKIYVSALTQINIDCHNRIPTTDTRLIRRIVRDNQYRGQTASGTLELWTSVRKGEEKNIFPFQENADVMFNSALIYELSVLKNYVEPLLKQIDRTDKNYFQAQRLLKILGSFKAIPDNEIPLTSILREFIGGSVFR
ncbi:nucleoside kinase [Halanaerobium sp. MA284_MarDTE_T2]|uniref:nucleoside kinase n=1 Tax=Halanaerobium sp. MA284_MarDTE_T2 TaxID=2183913 RepID=UPI000DF1A5A2|nr:nucleoside kinase [Halanaerobium sp. MA284_MarDTE_T2]RCW51471.1 uridine kinase [Halanaerobium sp. MA284_MarDTE_T2]